MTHKMNIFLYSELLDWLAAVNLQKIIKQRIFQIKQPSDNYTFGFLKYDMDIFKNLEEWQILLIES